LREIRRALGVRLEEFVSAMLNLKLKLELRLKLIAAATASLQLQILIIVNVRSYCRRKS